MKILQLVTRRQFRGAEVFTATLSEQLLRNKIQIVFLGLYPPPAPSLNIDGAINGDLNGKKKFLSLSLIRNLAAVIKRENPDIIQANGSDTLKYAIFARYFAGIDAPVIYRNISMVSTWVGNGFFKKKFYSFLFSKVDFVTSVGMNSIEDLVKLFNYPKERTSVIRRGIAIRPQHKHDAKKFVTDLFHLHSDVKIVVHVGSFTVEKNHPFLLSVFSAVRRSHPDAKLILVGDGPRMPAIRQIITDLQLQETVYLAGFRKDVDVFLCAADLFVLCSTVEGVPGVILEAAAQRTPSLAINVGGVAEVVKHNDTGILHPDFNHETFLSAMVDFLYDDKRLAELGTNAFQYVKENFDPVKNAYRFMQLYQALKR